MAGILIFGGSGFIGTYLKKYFQERQILVQIVGRKKENSGLYWNPETSEFSISDFENYDVFINLCGANIAEKPWSKAYQKELLRSRVGPTSCIAKMIAQLKNPPKVWLNISGLGFYGDAPNICTENSPQGKGFLAELSAQWEQAAQSEKTRVVLPRLPVVLHKNGGFLKETKNIYAWGLAPIFGNGQHYFPWVHLSDLGKIFEHIIQDTSIQGVVNIAAPEIYTQAEFSRKMAKIISKKRSVPFYIPTFLVCCIFGKTKAKELFLFGQNVKSEKLKNNPLLYSKLIDI
jgi:uncharacterized protein (TIGR01777 family)